MLMKQLTGGTVGGSNVATGSGNASTTTALVIQTDLTTVSKFTLIGTQEQTVQKRSYSLSYDASRSSYKQVLASSQNGTASAAAVADMDSARSYYFTISAISGGNVTVEVPQSYVTGTGGIDYTWYAE